MINMNIVEMTIAALVITMSIGAVSLTSWLFLMWVVLKAKEIVSNGKCK